MGKNRINSGCGIGKKGNAIIMGVVGVTLLAGTILMFTQGFVSSLKFKSRAQTKGSLTSVKDGVLNAFAKAQLYEAASNLSTALANKINIPQAGTLKAYDGGQASVFLAKVAASAPENAIKAICDEGNKIPVSDTSAAEFVFCFSTVSGTERTISSSLDSFFGSDAFGLMKVSLKQSAAPHMEFLTQVPQWGEFKTDANRTLNYQADISYNFVWGKKDDPSSIFISAGNVIKDLQ